jgi:ubiquinone/menaquinone biosynthesis C-methylase UbiE
MDGESRFWDSIAEKYARRPVADEASYQRKLEVTRGYLRPDMEVLEFGCGTGSTAVAHAPYVGHIRAIDISSKMLAIAKEKAEAAGVANITFEQAGIDDLAVPDGTYDVVLGMSILHLLADRQAAIAKVHRMLKPGGLFISSTTCLGETMRFMKVVGPVGKALGLMPLVRVFTPDELAASIAEAGFAIDHRWQPGRGKAVFIVARKAG